MRLAVQRALIDMNITQFIRNLRVQGIALDVLHIFLPIYLKDV
jgi:hypothetical protein